MVGAGMTLAVTVGLFAFGGYLLDGWLETTPLFLLLGLLLGATGGFIHLFSVVAPGMLPFGRFRAKGPERTDRSSRRPDAQNGAPRDPEPPSSPTDP